MVSILSSTRLPAVVLRLSRTLRSSTQFSTIKDDKPKSFLKSDANKHKVLYDYYLTPEERNRGKYATPLGISLFAFIVYIGFVREYGEEDQKKFEFLTKDISDKVPPSTYKKLKEKMEEEKETGKGNT